MNSAHLPERYTQNITLINYCQLCIDYELNKHILKKEKIEVAVTPVAIKNLYYLIPSRVQGKLLYPLKHKLAQNAHLYSTLSFSSVIITQLLSTCLKTELHLLPVSGIGKFHTLALNFGGWAFSITVRKYFRSNSDHSNERIYLNQSAED